MKTEINRVKLYLSALQSLGVDASPLDEAPDEYGCADSVSQIITKTFPNAIKGSVSTAELYKQLSTSKDFIKVSQFKFGDIIISPTGSAKSLGAISVGHTGIVGEDNKIMSNSSATGTWLENYTIQSWVDRYRGLGNFPIYFFRKI
jgi:hypothetical protein